MFNANDAVFVALADTNRRKLLETLAQDSPKTATQLAEQFPITRQGVLKHLDILEAAGLVQVQPRGREKRYLLTPAPLGEVNAWIEAVGAQWQRRLERLKALVENNEDLDTL
jgi:DNA-binding transcriptional ArsR family regulator